VKKLLLLPLRLSVGWSLSPRLLGLIACTMLVLLRVTIGYHFYAEGVDKVGTEWTAAPFFVNAKGPLAGQFRQMVWDVDGQYRLNRDAVMLSWASFRDAVGEHYEFDEQQKRQAQANYAQAVEQYDWVISENAADLEEYELGRQRIAELESDDQEKRLRDGVASLGGQRDTIRREWTAKAAPALSQIDKIWKNYETAQNSLATNEQRSVETPLRLVKPRTGLIVDTSVIDDLLPYFDIAVGLCLLFGLFTPLAALAAAGFLGSVFLSQYPPVTGPTSSIYQLIESMACLVLAGTGAGRFAGLDYFLHLIVRRVWGVPPHKA
jgi:uncharacterized membrane protein YphA (DoxX/SURF4 family)